MMIDGLKGFDSDFAEVSKFVFWILRIFRNFESGIKGVEAIVNIFLVLRSEAVKINKAPFCKVIFEFSDGLIFALRTQNFR